MYKQFFQLKQSPFSIAPDPRYLFMSERHREALAHLLYGVGSGGGFVLLTGEIGAGKTTVCRCFIEQIPENCQLAYIFNPKLSVPELLQSICEEFGIALPEPDGASVKVYVDAINRHLLDSHARSRNNVLIIDEAQNLSAPVLEQLRLLTNLETSERKLLQIILIGQPELRAMLARPELEQLAQRVIARYHLGSLSAAETGSYIEHRLAVAGSTAAIFAPGLYRQLHRLTQGVPRRINLLCDRALLGAYVENRHEVSGKILRRAAAEVFGAGAPASVPRRWPALAAATLAGAVVSAAALWLLLPGTRPAPPAARPAAAVAAPQTKPVRPLAAAAAAVVPAPAPRPPVPTRSDAQAGLRELAGLWGASLGAGDACQQAGRAGLRCLRGKGGFAELRQLDRPVLLTLREAGGAPAYLLLQGLDQQGATVLLDGRSQRLSLAELNDRLGIAAGADAKAGAKAEAELNLEFSTYWHAPRGWRDEVAAGDRGPEVDWLLQRLAEYDGVSPPPERQALAGLWRRRLRDFQLRQNLKADGLAGPKTFIRFSQLSGVAEPRLLGGAGVAVAARKK